MNHNEKTEARLTVQRVGEGLLQVGLAGDWVTQADLPGLAPVEKGFTEGPGPVKAMGFQTDNLGRWNSGLMIFVLECFELCARKNVEFLGQTLPAGVSALLKLSQSVPENKDASRRKPKPPFFERLGRSTIAASQGAMDMLTFVGASVLAFFKLLRGKAQFRWSDTFLVMEECGPKALGIVALINFLIGMILAFIGATQLAEVRRLHLHRRPRGNSHRA